MAILEQTSMRSADELVSKAQNLREAIGARAEDTEKNRAIAASSMKAIRDAGLIRVCQPARFGGFEYPVLAAYEIITSLAEACASTAWCTAIGAFDSWMLAAYPLQAQQDVWSNNADAYISGSIAPSARAARVDGGFKVSGRWSFSSGCDHADWSSVGVLVESESDGRVAPAFLLIPRSDFTIDDDWYTYGLSGTGSKTVVAKDIFVPSHRQLSFSDAVNAKGPGVAIHPNPLYRLPFLSVFPALLAAVAVGAAKGAVKQYVAEVSERETRGAVAGGKLRMAGFGTIQLRVAEAQSASEAGDLILRASLGRVLEIIESGRAMTIPERINCRREQAYAVKLAAQATELLNASTGGQGLSLHGRVQRAWRDANAVARHISLNWDTVGTMVGQSALGLEPVGQY